jgi:hypothetical protein
MRRAGLRADDVRGWHFPHHALGYRIGEQSPHRTRGKQQMLRLLRLVCGPALPVCFGVIGIYALGITAAAAEASEEARQACTGDAMRLCSEFVPDVAKITACMTRKRAQLSPQCRLAMAHEHLRYRHAARVYCRHRHCR